MPPTVKSLEERIDEMAGEVEALNRRAASSEAKLDLIGAQLATLVANENSAHTQLAVVLARFDSLIEQLRTTNTRLDAVEKKLDVMATDYTSHKSKAETTFALTRWIGAFVAGVFLTVGAGTLTVVRAAGSYESTIQQQQKTLDEIRRELGEVRAKQK